MTLRRSFLRWKTFWYRVFVGLWLISPTTYLHVLRWFRFHAWKHLWRLLRIQFRWNPPVVCHIPPGSPERSPLLDPAASQLRVDLSAEFRLNNNFRISQENEPLITLEPGVQVSTIVFRHSKGPTVWVREPFTRVWLPFGLRLDLEVHNSIIGFLQNPCKIEELGPVLREYLANMYILLPTPLFVLMGDAFLPSITDETSPVSPPPAASSKCQLKPDHYDPLACSSALDFACNPSLHTTVVSFLPHPHICRFQSAAQDMSRSGVAILPQLLPPFLLPLLRDHLVREMGAGVMRQGDKVTKWREPVAMHFNRSYLPFAQEITGRTLTNGVPLMLLYAKGSMLEVHCDAPGYDVSLSIALGFEPFYSCLPPYPFTASAISVLTRDPKIPLLEVPLQPGDGVIFLGRKVPHYRDTINEPFNLVMSFTYNFASSTGQSSSST